MRTRRRGFTLLELLIALGLIATVFAAATTRFHRLFVATRLRATAQGIGDHFAYAISRAYTSGSYHTLVFDLSEGRYWIEIGRQDEEGQRILKRRLGAGVSFTDIHVGYETYIPPGTLSIEVSPLGVTNDVLINLEDKDGEACAVALDAMVQGIEFHDGYKTYEELQDEPEF
ncbi:MAG: prepilin-type N-terminal cleavage/methylation domain-containing protein [Planctomycetes bacterium]|nr:prepilin-type N-terminal cleavage/methylation domain-containing protein [Planctomycetota bacterium]